MIIATAGHIDHGKTALVRALTGIDADRLPEERRRGMTIDLGFAYTELERGLIVGFVDVPGHERFVRNMLAGVAAIDLGLLIVAADDGPMPQTIEHLAILDLLGVPAGAIAITKADRVPPERLEEVTAETRLLVEGTALADAPLFPTSAVTGDGIPALRRHLVQVARRTVRSGASGHFRLSIDRAFTLRGVGLVVTGTAFAGAVRNGDRLVLSPPGTEVRVRGLHVQNRESHTGRAGQRCAINIAGPDLDRDTVRRGHWLVAAEAHAPTDRLDVRLRTLPGEGNAIRDRMPVHLHLAAEDVPARVGLLDDRVAAPGEAVLARLALDRPIGALAGDRFVVRDQSGRTTIGGGAVIDPWPPLRGRRRPERLAALAALEEADPVDALDRLLDVESDAVDFSAFVRARNLGPAETAALARRTAMVSLEHGRRHLALRAERLEQLESRIEAALTEWHGTYPDRPGAPPHQVRRALAPRPSRPLFDAVVARMVAGGRLARESGQLRLARHAVALGDEAAALWRRIEPLLEQGELRPPRVRELAEAVGADHREVEAVLRRGARMGLVADVAKNRYFPMTTIETLKRIAHDLADEAPDGRFTAQEYKDRSGIGRNVTIELLEYFDRTGFTRREGEARRIAGRSGRNC